MLGVLKSVSKHTIVYSLGDLFSRGLGFILLPLYLKYLRPDEYGALDLLDMTTFIVSILLAVGISQAVMRYYFEYEDQERRDQVVSVALISLWGMAVVALPILWYKSDFFSNLVFDSSAFVKPFMVVFTSMIIVLINEIPRALMRIRGQSALYITQSIIKLLIAITLNVILIVKYNFGIMGVLIGNLTSQLVVGAIMTIWVLRQIKLSWSTKLLKEMLSYSFPLVWTWLAMFVLNFGDRFLLQKLAGLYEVGIYSLAYKFGMIANILVLQPFMLTWFPKQFEIANEPDARQTYSKVFTYFAFMMLFCSLGLAVLIKDAVRIMAAENYYAAVPYVPVILFAYMAYGIYNFVQFGVHLKKKTKYLGQVTALVAVINVGLNFVLIPRLGIWGATIATGVSFLLLPTIIFPITQRLYHIPYEVARLIKLVLVAAAIFYTCWMINIETPYLSFIAKLVIALFYPVILRFIKFFTKEELNKLSSIVKQAWQHITMRSKEDMA